MTGSREGGLKAAAKLKAKDPAYYSKLAHASNSKPGRKRYSYFTWLKQNDPKAWKEFCRKAGGKKARSMSPIDVTLRLLKKVEL